MAWQAVLATVVRSLAARGAQASAARAVTTAGTRRAAAQGVSAGLARPGPAMQRAAAAGNNATSRQRVAAALEQGGSVLDALNSQGVPGGASRTPGIVRIGGNAGTRPPQPMTQGILSANRGVPRNVVPPIQPPAGPPVATGGAGGSRPTGLQRFADTRSPFGDIAKQLGNARSLMQFLRGVAAATRAIDGWTVKLVESQRVIGGLSGEAMSGFAALAIGRVERRIDRAGTVGRSLGDLARARNRYEEAIAPIANQVDRIRNQAGDLALQSIASVVETVGPVVEATLTYIGDTIDWWRGKDEPDLSAGGTLLDQWLREGNRAIEERRKRRKEL